MSNLFAYRLNASNIRCGGLFQKVDPLTHFRLYWDLRAGVWVVESFKQIAPDVPMARIVDTFLQRVNPDRCIHVKPDLVDSEYRFVGICAREVTLGSHYMAGILYNNREARLRIYKQYVGLPKIYDVVDVPSLDEASLDYVTLDEPSNMTIRGLSPRWKVVLTYLDGSSETITVPVGQTYIVKRALRLIKRVEIYDAAGRLVHREDRIYGGSDDAVLGGPGTFVLLADCPITWDYSEVKIRMWVRDYEIGVEVNGTTLTAIDTELYGAGPSGLRCYNAPATFRYWIRFK